MNKNNKMKININTTTNTNTNTVTHPIYRRNYIGIFRANLVITAPKITSPIVDLYQAEAKFLRAYYHFELFKHFGPIPVVLELHGNTMRECCEVFC